jgi:1-acyl-sn-glycerol-3-phosphate acyltransferase
VTRRQRDLLAAPVTLVQWVLGFLWTWFCIVAALVVFALTRSRRLPLAMAHHWWAPGLLALAPARLEVRGGEGVDWQRAHVFACNHESWIDVAAVFGALPVPLAFILKKELRRLPLVGWYAAAMGMIFVDRADRRGALESVDAAATALASGKNLVVFPEGTRSRTGEIGRFKSGGFAAPIRAGVEVVPVAIRGAGWVMPARSLAIRAGRIVVHVGTPIPTVGWSVDRRDELARVVESAVRELHASAD